MTPALKHRLEAALGARIVEAAPMAVGFGLTGLVVTLADGRCLAVKARDAVAASGAEHSPQREGPSLEIEAYMLGELARLSGLPVPCVHHAAPDLLVMDFIANDGAITKDAERHAGELIAALHGRPRDAFGYARDTVIGPLPQPNPRLARWIPFFREQRLMHMADAGRAAGRLPAAMHARLARLAGRLDELLIEPAHPALLHGDLWTGNVLVRDGRIAGFVDPAIYCGHPEIELAFATLFGTFGRAFFEAYAAVLPLPPGFHEERRDLYNLYPLLVHVRLFGASYLAGVDRVLARFGV